MRRAERGRAACRLLALAVALAAGDAAAQGTGGAPAAERQGRFHLGPFWLTPRIVLRNAGSDSNVFNDAEAPVSDRSGALEPSLDALLPLGRRARLLGRGAVGLAYFQRERDERSTDLFGNTRAELDLGPATLFGGLAGGRHKQRFSLEIDERFERRERSVSGGANLKLGRRFTLGAGATSSRFRYDDAVTVAGDAVDESLDRDTRSYTGTVAYALTPRTALSFAVDIVEDEFLADRAPAAGSLRSYRYTGGFSFSAGGLFTGQARAGVRSFPENDAELAPAYDGLTLSVDLQTRLGRLGALQLLAQRDVNYAVQRAASTIGTLRNSYVSSRYGATINRELLLSLVARGSAYFDRADYVLPYVEAGRPLDRVDRLRTLGFGLFRAFGPSFRVGGTIEWSRRESNRAGFDYERRVYGVSAEYTP